MIFGELKSGFVRKFEDIFRGFFMVDREWCISWVLKWGCFWGRRGVVFF